MTPGKIQLVSHQRGQKTTNSSLRIQKLPATDDQWDGQLFDFKFFQVIVALVK